MTIGSNFNEVTFQGDGTSTTFTFNFDCGSENNEMDPSEVGVWLISTDGLGTLTQLNYGPDYSVAFNDDGPGGTVTLTIAPALAQGGIIRRDLDFLQDVSLGLGPTLDERAIMTALDRNVMMMQAMEADVGHAIRLPYGSTMLSSLPATVPAAGLAVVVNANSNGFTYSTYAPDSLVTIANAAAASAAAAQSAAAAAEAAALGGIGGAAGNVQYNSGAGTLAGASKTSIDGSGQLVCTGTASFVNGSVTGTFGGACDQRLKQNVEEVDGDILWLLEQLRVVTYQRKATPRKTEVGLIAQEVAEVFPLLVGRTPDGYLTLDYMGLIATLVKSLQQLSAKVQELEAKRA